MQGYLMPPFNILVGESVDGKEQTPNKQQRRNSLVEASAPNILENTLEDVT
jgi:hypothetical protein